MQRELSGFADATHKEKEACRGEPCIGHCELPCCQVSVDLSEAEGVEL